jgi:hypothetical protein
MFKRLIGRNFVTSLLSSLPGLTIGISFERFYLVGKTRFRKHSLYIPVMYFGKVSNACLKISPVIPSSPGACLLVMLSTAFLISAKVNYLSSGVFTVP